MYKSSNIVASTQSSASACIEYSPHAASIPFLRANATPVLIWWITLNLESFFAYSSQITDELSVLPSSTIITSKSGIVCTCRLSSMRFIVFSALYMGIMMEIFILSHIILVNECIYINWFLLNI